MQGTCAHTSRAPNAASSAVAAPANVGGQPGVQRGRRGRVWRNHRTAQAEAPHVACRAPPGLCSIRGERWEHAAKENLSAIAQYALAHVLTPRAHTASACTLAYAALFMPMTPQARRAPKHTASAQSTHQVRSSSQRCAPALPVVLLVLPCVPGCEWSPLPMSSGSSCTTTARPTMELAPDSGICAHGQGL